MSNRLLNTALQPANRNQNTWRRNKGSTDEKPERSASAFQKAKVLPPIHRNSQNTIVLAIVIQRSDHFVISNIHVANPFHCIRAKSTADSIGSKCEQNFSGRTCWSDFDDWRPLFQKFHFESGVRIIHRGGLLQNSKDKHEGNERGNVARKPSI